MLLVKNESKSDLIKEQNIDFGETFLFGNILNLVGIP